MVPAKCTAHFIAKFPTSKRWMLFSFYGCEENKFCLQADDQITAVKVKLCRGTIQSLLENAATNLMAKGEVSTYARWTLCNFIIIIALLQGLDWILLCLSSFKKSQLLHPACHVNELIDAEECYLLIERLFPCVILLHCLWFIAICTLSIKFISLFQWKGSDWNHLSP